MAPEMMTADAVIRTETARSSTTGEPVDNGEVSPGLSGEVSLGLSGEVSLCTMADLDRLVAELDDVDATLSSLR